MDSSRQVLEFFIENQGLGRSLNAVGESQKFFLKSKKNIIFVKSTTLNLATSQAKFAEKPSL